MKRAAINLLLFFVFLTIGIQVGSLFQTIKQMELPEGRTVLVFHAAVRCPTCLTMERLTQQTIAKSYSNQKLRILSLDYEQPKNQALAEKYQIGASGILLVDKSGTTERVFNLAAESWTLIGNEPAFIAMLKSNLDLFLRGDPAPIPDANSGPVSTEIPQDVQSGLNWD